MKSHDVITRFITNNRKFSIIKSDGVYLAIEDKYITDGRINTQLNGAQMNVSKTLDGCIENTERACKRDEYIEQGYSKLVAVELAYGYTLEEALKIEAISKEMGLA